MDPDQPVAVSSGTTVIATNNLTNSTEDKNDNCGVAFTCCQT